ncbi:DEAD/DEAH box helicase [Actinoplanes sp. NPDC051851]|uniref:DEAD/DEAH box helicase n=1 Tax=Actinoplanes sp. NPDC051851 TaxID=3154753 RepID=UPI0034303C10
MARFVLTGEEAAICEAVGVTAFAAARAIVALDEVFEAGWDVTGQTAAGRLRGRVIGTVSARPVVGPDGAVKGVEGTCSCRWAPDCYHVVAVLLAAGLRPLPRSWETALTSLIGDDGDDGEPNRRDDAGPSLALQFEVEPGTRRLAIRPVVPGRTGWSRSMNWQSLSYGNRGWAKRTRQQAALLQEIYALAHNAHYGYAPRVIHLDEIRNHRVWDILAEARDAGLPLVNTGRPAEPVILHAESFRFTVQADRDDDGLVLRPVLTDGAIVIDPASMLLIGDPAHGVAWWEPGHRSLRLARTRKRVGAEAALALAAPPIVVPADQEQAFLRQYYPGLARTAEVVVVSDAVTLPDLDRATLTLTGRRLPGHRLAVLWDWVIPLGDDEHREPFSAVAPRGSRARTLQAVTGLLAEERSALIETGQDGPRLRGETLLAGDAMIRLLRDVLPRLAEIPDVAVELWLDDTEYVEETGSPEVLFETSGDGGQRDWFDLAVRVTVGGEQVDFQQLFVALAEEQEFLILPSGRYFALDQPELRRLHDLIVESRALHDTPSGAVRVGRFQAAVLQDLTEVGTVTGKASAWLSSLGTLTATDQEQSSPLPAGWDATLRGYQAEGFRWLATRYRHRLGGILADDMGLGKTLQTLALICHAVEERLTDAPFLVVAPASVVGNWAAEAARFAPGLTVTPVQQTRARRRGTLAETVAGAHLVVTSYTLFRLEYQEYAALPWAGLILDEAQFVKNPSSQGYRCAKQLPTDFKLAVTGTPMENSLDDLWALFSITAPGLLARNDRFADYYRRPIERERDQDRLAHLRRRIRPLMLRRRKQEVAAELPPKQEQVLDVELNPRHRRVYQIYLQRERQKVLGLLGDLQKNRFEIFRSLTLLRQASLDVSLVDPQHAAIPSTKLDTLVDRVTDIVAEGHRILVFSQFTRFLTAARTRLEAAGVACSYLDGQTSDRTHVIADFKAGAAPVFLVSLKAGGFGLNLTEADYCILLDPWWNPAAEAQAVDRVHRIGQTRNVMVYRMVARDTIEEKVMALQARKAELFTSLLDGGDFSSTSLTAADIRSLLD